MIAFMYFIAQLVIYFYNTFELTEMKLENKYDGIVVLIH